MVFAVNTGDITSAQPLSSITDEKEAPAYSAAIFDDIQRV